MHQRGRRRDEHGRFLPRESVNLKEEIEGEVEFPFEDVTPNFPVGSSSRVESFDTSALQPFSEILASFLDSSSPNPPIVNNPAANTPFH